MSEFEDFTRRRLSFLGFVVSTSTGCAIAVGGGDLLSFSSTVVGINNMDNPASVNII